MCVARSLATHHSPVTRLHSCTSAAHILSQTHGVQFALVFAEDCDMQRVVLASIIAIGCCFDHALAATNPPAIDNDDIGGAIEGPMGAEAGVWVIAETS